MTKFVAPVLQPLGDVVVPSAGVGVLGGLWCFLNLGVDDQIVLGCVVSAQARCQ